MPPWWALIVGRVAAAGTSVDLYGLILSGRRVVGAVTSIERTAYPQFKRLPSARELHVFYAAAGRGGVGAGDGRVRGASAGVAGPGEVFRPAGYFPALAEVPAVVAGHVRRCGFGEDFLAARCGQRVGLPVQVLGRARDPGVANALAGEGMHKQAHEPDHAPKPGSVTQVSGH